MHNEVKFDIPKLRNGRRLSAFGYAKSPHDTNYVDGCNDGISGIPTVYPNPQVLYMKKFK